MTLNPVRMAANPVMFIADETAYLLVVAQNERVLDVVYL